MYFLLVKRVNFHRHLKVYWRVVQKPSCNHLIFESSHATKPTNLCSNPFGFRGNGGVGNPCLSKKTKNQVSHLLPCLLPGVLDHLQESIQILLSQTSQDLDDRGRSEVGKVIGSVGDLITYFLNGRYSLGVKSPTDPITIDPNKPNRTSKQGTWEPTWKRTSHDLDMWLRGSHGDRMCPLS